MVLRTLILPTRIRSSATSEVLAPLLEPNRTNSTSGRGSGLAYRVTADTVIRTGYAKSFPIGFNGANFGAVTNDWPNATRQDIEQTVSPYVPAVTFAGGVPAFVSGFQLLAAAGNPGEYPTPNSEGFGWDYHNPTNSVDQWNFTVEHQFGAKATLSVSYVGNAVRHLFFRINWNAARSRPIVLPRRRCAQSIRPAALLTQPGKPMRPNITTRRLLLIRAIRNRLVITDSRYIWKSAFHRATR